jgi:hypothetical protein
MESGWLISLHSEGLMYLRRQVRQPILLRLFAGRSCDWAPTNSIAGEVDEIQSVSRDLK